MSVSYAGFNVNSLTFCCSMQINKGTPVKLYRSNSVMPCVDGDVFHGIAVDGDEKYVAVQMKGIVTVNYSGTAPTAGLNKLGANVSGGIKVTTNGNEYLVLSVDEDAKTVTFLM